MSCNLKRAVQTDTQTHRAYKWLQVPPFNLTVNVGNDNMRVSHCPFVPRRKHSFWECFLPEGQLGMSLSNVWRIVKHLPSD